MANVKNASLNEFPAQLLPAITRLNCQQLQQRTDYIAHCAPLMCARSQLVSTAWDSLLFVGRLARKIAIAALRNKVEFDGRQPSSFALSANL